MCAPVKKSWFLASAVFHPRSSLRRLDVFLFGPHGDEYRPAVVSARSFRLTPPCREPFSARFSAGYALFQIPGGLLADKYGPQKGHDHRHSLVVGFYVINPALVGSYPLMLLCRFVFGIGEGCFPGASFKAIATYFPAKQKATATAIMSTMNTLGPAFATLLGAGIHFRFRLACGFHRSWAFPGLSLRQLSWFYYKDAPAEHPHMSGQEVSELYPAGPSDKLAAAGGEQKVSYLAVLKNPELWQMLIIWFFFAVTFWGFISWLPSYLLKVRGFSPDQDRDCRFAALFCGHGSERCWVAIALIM